jgi:antitoxin component YwqK of YwqJK toxin-antitoxin module
MTDMPNYSKQTKVHFDEIEFDPTCQVYTVTASYKGELFTGTAYFIDENYNAYYEWTYKNGKADGRWFAVDQTTQQLVNEKFYIDGDQHGISTDWFLGGAKESVSVYELDHCIFRKRWNKEGALVMHFDERNDIDTEYYDDGSLYFDTVFDTSNGFTKTYYRQTGIWLMKRVGADRKIMGGYKNVFNENELLRNSEILDSTFHREIVNQFIWFLRRERPDRVIDYLIALLNHNDSTIKAEAIIRLGELQDVVAIPYLEKYLNDHTQPRRYERFSGIGAQLTNIYEIGVLAQRSLNQILQHRTENQE